MKRSRHVGFVDDHLDEDIEIDVSAALTSEGMQITHHQFPVGNNGKRPRTQNTDEQAKPTLTGAIPLASTFEVVDASTSDKEKQRNQV